METTIIMENQMEKKWKMKWKLELCRGFIGIMSHGLNSLKGDYIGDYSRGH